MTTATEIRPETTEAPQPSVEKYGEIVLQDGFTQHPNAVRDYLVKAGFTPREILYIQVLESYRWEPGQEVFPSVRTIAEKIGVQERQTRNISKKLHELKLIPKGERFEGDAQTSNHYNLESVYSKTAAQRDPEVAVALAEQEAKEQEAFQPVDLIDETAQVLCKVYSDEPTPAEMHDCAKRLRRLWSKVDKGQQSDREDFNDLLEQAIQRTKDRKDRPTRTGRAFTKLMAYFFSAFDQALSSYKAMQKAHTLRTINSQAKQTISQPEQTSQAKQTISQYDQAVSQPDQTVGQYDQAVSQAKRTVRQPEQTSQAKQTVGQYDQAVSQTKQTISQPNQTVSQYDQAISEAKRIVSQPNQTVGQHDQTVSQTKQTISQPNQTVGQYDQAVSQPNRTVSEAKRIVSQYDQAVSQAEQIVSQYDQAVSQPDQTVGWYDQAVSQVEQTVGQYDQAVSQAEQIVSQYDQAVSQARRIVSQPDLTVSWYDRIVSQPNQIADQYKRIVSQYDRTVSQPNQAVSQLKKGQQPKKSGPLAERAAARRAAEQAGQRRVPIPDKLALHIAAASDTFYDQEKKSSPRRAANLMADARLDEQTMLQFVAEARLEASSNTQIRARTKHGAINRMPYFFNSLERRIEEFLAQ